MPQQLNIKSGFNWNTDYFHSTLRVGKVHCHSPSTCINSLWPSEDTWHRWSLVSTSCLVSPSHYLNQRWLTTNDTLWVLFQGNAYLNINLMLCLKFTYFNSHPHLTGDNELRRLLSSMATTKWVYLPEILIFNCLPCLSKNVISIDISYAFLNSIWDW